MGRVSLIKFHLNLNFESVVACTFLWTVVPGSVAFRIVFSGFPQGKNWSVDCIYHWSVSGSFGFIGLEYRDCERVRDQKQAVEQSHWPYECWTSNRTDYLPSFLLWRKLASALTQCLTECHTRSSVIQVQCARVDTKPILCESSFPRGTVKLLSLFPKWEKSFICRPVSAETRLVLR